MIKEKERPHLTLYMFIAFVTLSFILLLVFQAKALEDMRLRNNMILAHYEDILNVNSPVIDVGELNLANIIKDFNLTPTQIIDLQLYSKDLIEQAVSKSHVDLEVNSIVEAKATAMYQETHDLLEMQFAKIQHETESLQIWCGLMTIVFLIFSFYSLFKTDELVQQGRNGVKELGEIKIAGKNSIEEFVNKSNGAIVHAARRAILEKRSIQEKMEAQIESAKKTIDNKVVEANHDLDKKFQDLAAALKNSDNYSHENSAFIATLEQIQSSINIINSRLELLESKD